MNLFNLKIDDKNLEYSSEIPTSIKNHVSETEEKTNTIITNRFLDIDLHKDISVENFVKILGIFAINIKLKPLQNKEEYNDMIIFIKKMYFYIIANKNSILSLDGVLLDEIVNNYMGIFNVINSLLFNSSEMERISNLTSIPQNELNDKLRNLRNLFTINYPFFLEIIDKQILKKKYCIKNNDDTQNNSNLNIFIKLELICIKISSNEHDILNRLNLEKFKSIFYELELICIEIVNNDDVLDNLTGFQLSYLLNNLNYIIKKIDNKLLSKNGFENIEQKKGLMLISILLKKTKIIVNKKLALKEFSSKISEFKNIIHEIKADDIATDNVAFYIFIENFRKFKNPLFSNEKYLQKLDKETLFEIKNILLTFTNILNNIIKFHETLIEPDGNKTSSFPNDINFNAIENLKYITSFIEKNNLFI